MDQKEHPKKWLWPSKLPEEIIQALNSYSLIERQLLNKRNIYSVHDAEIFLNNFPPEIDNPFLMIDMEKSVMRIISAKEVGENVVIYGDYDADGITATALMLETLWDIGINARYYIPDRMTEGYGLHKDALTQLASQGINFVITVDCGIRSVEEIQYAKNLGLDVIITDHHAPGPEIPEAYAIINPKQQGDNYPFKGFAGVGLAYKLSQALLNSCERKPPSKAFELVAIGTVADLAPLVAENRYLVSKGIERINQTERMGLQALIEVSGINRDSIDANTIGFSLGPRINAAGRLAHAAQALELLLTEEKDRAIELAHELDSINRKRQQLTGEVLEQAKLIVQEEGRSKNLLFAAHPEFHEGIVGLAASRLMEEFYKPTIVANKGEKYTRGSARSIPGFHITEAFDHCADLLQQYGGHSSAAGFTIKTSDLELFCQRIEVIAAEKMSTIECFPLVDIEAEISFDEINSSLLSFVDRLQPCGNGNPRPLFGTKNVQVLEKRVVGKDRKHLKLMLKREGRMFDAIAFRKGELVGTLPPRIDIAFFIERHVYMGYESIQLNIQEIQW